MSSNTTCPAGYIPWIYSVFGDCIVTSKDRVSFYFGLLSTVIWIISAFPQFYTAYKIKKVDGVSPFLFSFLFTADILSFIGNILTGGIASQILLAGLYIILDGSLFFQFLYYRHKNKDIMEKLEKENVEKGSDFGINGTTVVLAGVVAATTFDIGKPYRGDQLLGTIFGWISGIIYISSRIPQVTLNCRKKFVSDLSPFYFVCTISGNTTYLLSLFIRSTDVNFLWKQAPWLTGVIVPLSLDVTTMLQMWCYGYSVAPLFPIKKDDEENITPVQEVDRPVSEL